MAAASAKLILICSLAAAGTLNVWLAAYEWPALPFFTVATVGLIYVFARRWSGAVTFAVAMATWLAPAAFALLRGRFLLSDLTLWLAAVLTLIIVTSWPLRWHVPARWVWPLAFWSLVIAVSWPVIVAREAEYSWTLLFNGGIQSSGAGGAPRTTVLWITHVVLVFGVGLLWADWLCARYGSERRSEFTREILAGFGIGWVIASLVALYQVTIDFEFVNMPHWAFQRRAAGTLMDANPFGLVAALAGPAVVVALWPLTTARHAVLAFGALGLSWFGLWASGSRAALLAGSIALVGVVRYAGHWRPAGIQRRQVATLLGVGLVVIAMLVVTAMRVDNPVSRLARLAPDGASAVGSWFAYVWERESYGTAANRMLHDSPVFGVGIGSYHALVPDYAQALVGRRLPPDNAQNWFRHQLAELGLLGSLGWIIWVAGFVHLIAAGQYKPDREVQAGMLRWLLLALGAASFVGVPTLNATAAFSFWVLAVWFVLQLEPRALRPVWVPRASSWVLALVLAGVYAVGLAQVSRVELRVPHRARLGEWDLQHGFHDPEPSAAHGEYRWSLKNAVTVMHADTHRLRLTLWVNHPDAAERPVQVKVWRDDELVVNVERSDATPVVREITIPAAGRRVMLSTWVDRTWQPTDVGEQDTRELGMAIAWRFLSPDAPGTVDVPGRQALDAVEDSRVVEMGKEQLVQPVYALVELRGETNRRR